VFSVWRIDAVWSQIRKSTKFSATLFGDRLGLIVKNWCALFSKRNSIGWIYGRTILYLQLLDVVVGRGGSLVRVLFRNVEGTSRFMRF